MDSCTLQTLGNITVMIIAALFAGIRMSRCRRIKTTCFECERVLVNETPMTTASMNRRDTPTATQTPSSDPIADQL